MIVDQKIYRKAFQEYLRNGTPIAWTLKNHRTITHYIWRTQGNPRVRSTHRHRDGKIFSWDNPPPGGHPGEAPNCRCRAEPYYADVKSDIKHELNIPPSTGKKWNWIDFTWHCYFGNHSGVTLQEIGHSELIAESWAYKKNLLQKWTGMILEKAADIENGTLSFNDRRQYPDFEDVSYPHGNAPLDKSFSGSVQTINGIMEVVGTSEYRFADRFDDPADLREVLRALGYSIDKHSNVRREDQTIVFRLTEIYGRHYSVTGHWSSELSASVSVKP